MKRGFDLLTKKEIIKISEEYFDFLTEINETDYVKLNAHLFRNQFWTKDEDSGEVVTAHNTSILNKYNTDGFPVVSFSKKDIGILPVIRDRKEYEKLNDISHGATMVKKYEYPMSVELSENVELNKSLQNGTLLRTGREFDGHIEYFYKGKTYIQCETNHTEVINHDIAKVGQKVWVRVEPVEWLNVKSLKMFVCKNILLNGSFNDTVYNGRFNQTTMCKKLAQMHEEMSKELNSIAVLMISDNDVNNPLKFKFVSQNELPSDILRSKDITISDFAQYTVRNKCTDYYVKDKKYSNKNSSYSIGYLPVVDYDLIKDKCQITSGSVHYLTVEFGEYPTVLMDNKECTKLSSLIHGHESYYDTLKEYTFNNEYVFMDNPIFHQYFLTKAREYEIHGEKYARTTNNEWFRVEKLKWIVDLRNNLAYCLTVPFAGLDYDLNGNIEESDLNRFIMKYFSHEIIPSKGRNIDKINEMISSDIAIQMLMNKENISVENLEIEGESKLVLRR